MDDNNPSCSALTTSEDQLSFLFADDSVILVCDSGAGSEEGGGYGVEEPVNLIIPHRSGSKRARAAEVHNLTERRRRSRINEKMKALQNLIPNSTKKTDKASMLDEAIEYLKQLQLQVQMLSMRLDLTSHTMYLPGALQPLQASNQSINFEEHTLTMNTDVLGMLLLNPDFSSLNSLDLTGQCTPSHQTVLLPTADVSALESSQTHDRSFQELFREGMGSQQQLDSGTISENSSDMVGFSFRGLWFRA